jgi:exosortase
MIVAAIVVEMEKGRPIMPAPGYVGLGISIAPGTEFAYALLIPLSISTLGQIAQVAAPQEQIPTPPSKSSWWQAAVLTALIGWLYSSILWRLGVQWWDDPNFSHGFFVPAFSLYVLWLERFRLISLRRKPSGWGLLIMVIALSTLILGVMGAELFLSRVSLLFLIAGLVVYFLGWNYFRETLFPWVFLILMIPIPALILNQITFPLQVLASKVSAVLLPLFGVPVLREGNVIILPAMALEVAEACSGIRSLLSLTTLAIIYGYLMETRLWFRIALALASVPIAVAANSLRIVGTGLLVQYWDPSKGEGFFHAFSGWLIFVVSLVMLFLLHKFLHLFERNAEVRT